MENIAAGQTEGASARRWQPSILVYLIVMNFILLCLLFPTLALYFFQQEKDFQNAHLDRMLVQMRHDLEHRSSSLAHSLSLSAGQAIAGFNYSFLNILANQIVSEDSEIIYCFVMDMNRKVIAHNDTMQIGQILEDKTSFMIAEIENKIFLARLTDEEKSAPIRFFDVNVKEANEYLDVMEVVTPVYSGAVLAGYLRCGYSLKDLHAEINKVKGEWGQRMERLKASFYTITFFFFIVGAFVSFLFTRTFVRSMRVLSDSVGKIAKGDLKHRISMDGLVCQEFTHLSDSFNSMTEKLGISYEQLEQYSRNLEQKVEERTKDLKKAQAELLRQAHEAGMAEMAVGILHNIGNAITPAKISAALLIKKISESRVPGHIREMMARFSAVMADTTEVSPEEMEQVKQMVSVLPDAVMEDYEHINNEIKLIRDKHEHIESIIRLQLRYAKISGNIENVEVNKVVHDALEMLDESISKYSVTIIQELDPGIPSIRIELAMLLQVMVNLLKNAIEAMADTDPDKRFISVSTSVDRKRMSLVIAVKDTGMGFDAESRKKLFTYGYTTKKEGSGFGLHSCANFIIAHNGSIEAISEGYGKGAEFIVHLPISQDGGDTKNEREQS